MWRKQISVIVVLVVLVIGLVVGGSTGAAAAKKPEWSISFTGGINGKAKEIKPACDYSPNGQSALIAQATFKVGNAGFRISIQFGPPVEPGPREFGLVAGARTVVVGVTDASDPTKSWVSSAGGTGTINENRRSGVVRGTLAGLGANAVATEVDANFECSKASTATSGDVWSGTFGSEWNGTQCTGSSEGTMTVRVTGKKASGSAEWSGSFTCPGVPYSGGGPASARLTGRFTGDEFRLNIEGGIVGIADNVGSCFGVPRSGPLVIEVTGRKTARASFDETVGGDQFTCDITLARR